MLRTAGMAIACATALALGACSDPADEPTGLTGDTASPDATETTARSGDPSNQEPEPTGSPEDSASTEGAPSPSDRFTQPYLPEERVVNLRDTVPVDAPGDASESETAVVEAFEHVQGSWEQILWGVPFDQTRIEQFSTGEHLETMREYAQESVDLKRVSVGPAQPQHLLGVEADDDSGTVRFCVNSSGWVDVIPDQPPKIDDALYLGTMTFERTDDGWKSNLVEYADDVSPCEGVFP